MCPYQPFISPGDYLHGGLEKISPKPQGDIFSIEKGGHERKSPVPGDHFDFPCCGGV